MLRNILPLLVLVALCAASLFFMTQSLIVTGSFLAGSVLTKLADTLTSSYMTRRLTLYIGNLPYKAHEQAIKDLFSQYGEVYSLRLVKDRYTGKKKGFGFIEMSVTDAKKALKNLNDSIFQERTLIVRIAKSQEEKEPV